MNHSKFLLFVDGLKIYQDTNNDEDCTYLQDDINSI
jgi:hypothetical protein